LEKDRISKPKCRALLIGGSAGSIQVIIETIRDLKTTLTFPVVIILHRKVSIDNSLAELFAHRTKLPTSEIEDKEKITEGSIFVCPADYHLLFESNGYFSLDDSEKVNYSRPSIDVSFESAAEVYKDELVCILLSGANSDGTAGLKKVRDEGGFAVVQDPLTAEVSYMPDQAIHAGYADLILSPDKMADFINSL
jgi:two-component system chemotaxis response regulator CheB